MRNFMLAMMLVIISSTAALAQTDRSEPIMVFRFDPADYSIISRALQNGQGERVIQTYGGNSFIYPVRAGSETICTFRPNGQFECRPMVYYERCPTAIEVTVPNSDTSVDIPVSCTGPDQNGNCTCEVRDER